MNITDTSERTTQERLDRLEALADRLEAKLAELLARGR
jgi:hypothetical protein